MIRKSEHKWPEQMDQGENMDHGFSLVFRILSSFLNKQFFFFKLLHYRQTDNTYTESNILQPKINSAVV